MVVEGKDKLCFNSIREGTDSVNCCTTCCDCTSDRGPPELSPGPEPVGGRDDDVPRVLPDHRWGHGHAVRIRGGPKTFEPFMAVQTGDWPDQAALDKYDVPRLGGSHRRDARTWLHRHSRMGHRVWQVHGERVQACRGSGETFAELLAGAGGKISILGITEGAAALASRPRRQACRWAALSLSLSLSLSLPPPPPPPPPRPGRTLLKSSLADVIRGVPAAEAEPVPEAVPGLSVVPQAAS